MKKGTSKYFNAEQVQALKEKLASTMLTAPEIMIFLGYSVEVAYSNGNSIIDSLEYSGLLLYEEKRGKNVFYGALDLKKYDQMEEERRKQLCLTM